MRECTDIKEITLTISQIFLFGKSDNLDVSFSEFDKSYTSDILKSECNALNQECLK